MFLEIGCEKIPMDNISSLVIYIMVYGWCSTPCCVLVHPWEDGGICDIGFIPKFWCHSSLVVYSDRTPVLWCL
jgi:hypothetical protein